MVALVPLAGGHWAIWTLPGTLSAALAGAVCLVAGAWLARGMIAVDAWAMRSLLGPSRVSELERTRAIAVEDAAAALRRVERDLHDGAQVRLAAVAMNLGTAQEKAGDGALRELLDAAQAGVSGALADLRRIARGIHPPALDSGLADALDSLAASSPVDHHDRCPGDFVGRPDRRRVADDERVDDPVSEGATSLQEDTERVREGPPGGGHVSEAGQHGPHQVLLGQRPDEPAVVIQDHQMADLGNADHLGCPPDGRPEPYVCGKRRHHVAD